MSKHLIFLVHGMGEWQAGWSGDTQDLIRELYGRYPYLNSLPFDDRFKFVEVRYDQHFEERREQWKTEAAAVLSTMEAGGLESGVVSKLMDIVAAPGESNFLTTHVLDVLLYRFVPLVAEQVKVSVARQIVEAILAARSGPVQWSVIAHSLGTAVTHDTLDGLYNTAIPGLDMQTLTPADLKAQTIVMLANVSRVLQTKAKVYQSAVRPSLSLNGGACDYLVSVRHKWDPFPMPRPFEPTDDWPDMNTRQAGRYHGIITNAIEEFNVHDRNHYLRNPRVHIPLFRTLTADFYIDGAQEQAAVRAFEEATPLSSVQTELDRLKTLMSGENAGWAEIVDVLIRFFKELSQD